MPRKFRPYIAQSLGDLLDKMGFLLLSSPTFLDKTGYFPEQNLDTTFYALNESIKRLRHELGDDLYSQLLEMSDHMRAYFEADPNDENGKTAEGQKLVLEMERMIEARARST